MNKKLWEASKAIKNKSNLFKYEEFLEKNYNYKISKKFQKLLKWSIDNPVNYPDMVENYMDYTEILGWIATAILLVGYYLNAKQYIYSWLVWLVGNSMMMIYAMLIQSYSVAFLSIVLVFLNIFGFYSWRKNKS